jgi:hypothetical protein
MSTSELDVSLMAPSECATHALSRFHCAKFAQWQKAKVEKLDVADVRGDADRLNGRRQDHLVSMGRLDHVPVRDPKFPPLAKSFVTQKNKFSPFDSAGRAHDPDHTVESRVVQ